MMISRNLFILAHQIGDIQFYPTYKRLVQDQWKSYEELKEEQEKQLRYVIDFAYKKVPYYHKLFDDLKLSANDVRKIDDLGLHPKSQCRPRQHPADYLRLVNYFLLKSIYAN